MRDLQTEIIKNNNDNLCLTIKNYYSFKGLSAHICNALSSTKVEVEGPCGLGLGIKPRGRHVAFAAGTGILVFIDIVAHLIIRLVDLRANFAEPKIDLDNFQFVLYSSFVSDQESIAIGLCKALQELCKRAGKEHLFIHHSRITEASKPPEVTGGTTSGDALMAEYKNALIQRYLFKQRWD